jgi:ribosomal protein S18 acetylase RimI-like enzyme
MTLQPSRKSKPKATMMPGLWKNLWAGLTTRKVSPQFAWTIPLVVLSLAFVLYERHFKRLHVANVAVAKLYRRRGIAQALLRHVANDALSRLCTRVTLEVRKSNASAIACYEQLGYVHKKVIPQLLRGW